VTVVACPRVIATVTNGPIRSACRKSDLSRHLLPITKRSFWPGSPGPQIIQEVVPGTERDHWDESSVSPVIPSADGTRVHCCHDIRPCPDAGDTSLTSKREGVLCAPGTGAWLR
jgi:hypothetical protein